MAFDRNQTYWQSLVQEICKLPVEITWLEFKHNNADPQTIGKY